MGRFAAANSARITDHMRSGLERAVAAYRGNRSAIQMPAAEPEVEAAHTQLAKFVREGLALHGKGVDDTETFIDAHRRLEGVLVEGYQQIRQKNVELWKVHSDDATRCAAHSIREQELRCGVICLFNSVPWVHKSYCRRFLRHCFQKSEIASRMLPDMQNQVFEIWYTRDLGIASQRATNHFTMLFCTLLVIMIVVWWRISSSRQYCGQGYAHSAYEPFCATQSGFGLQQGGFPQSSHFRSPDAGGGYGGGLWRRSAYPGGG